MVREVIAYETKFGTLAHTFDACKALELQEMAARMICTCCGEQVVFEDLDICLACREKVKEVWKELDKSNTTDKYIMCRRAWETEGEFTQRIAEVKERPLKAPRRLIWDDAKQAYRKRGVDCK
ncbi:MAG: hypothetical protein PHT13_00305 [Methanosarcina sp.]|nr:hypothetical protein [Methanosarcina sp.]